MSVFAAFSFARSEWPGLVDAAFIVYVVVSFVAVLNYGVRKIRAGTMFDGVHAPMRLSVSGPTGWVFAACVLILLFSQSVLYMILVVMAVAAFLAESRRTGTEQFGLNRIPPGKLVGWSLLICGAVIFVELPLSEGIDRLMTTIRLPHPEQETVEAFRKFNQPGQIFAFMVQAVLISPLIEELFFRGFLLGFLKNYTSIGWAIVLSGGVFAFAHANLGSALQLWILGIVLGVAYEHAGSLLLPIGIHACWNLLTALSLLLEKGNS
jgi:membrane protease YdiL (CAAX protease family)